MFVSLDNNVEMTTPVLMKMETKSEYLWEKKFFLLSFLLPSAHQANPPTPADAKVGSLWHLEQRTRTKVFSCTPASLKPLRLLQVKIVEMPETTVYVKCFGGWMTATYAKQKAKAMLASLESVGAKFESDYFYAAGYNR